MDFQLYLRVLWRFRFLVAAGAVIGFGLAFLSVVRVDPAKKPHLAYRSDEQWISFSTLFVTQPGFPWGRSILGANAPTQRQPGGDVEFADPARLSELAVLYAQLATSDQVRQIIRDGGPMDGEIDASPVLASNNTFAAPLPLIRISAISNTSEGAKQLVVRTTDAFRRFLELQQSRNAIPTAQRVLVTVVKRAEKPKLLAGRSMTVPIVVFLSMMILVSGLAFVLENMRPRVRAVAAEEPPAVPARDAA